MSTIHKANISKLDIGTLMALEVLLSQCSVSKAARSVSLTQPAMSNTLARMRIAFDDPLLARSGNGMVRTALGDILLAQLRQILPDLRNLGAATVAFDPETSDAVFRIAITDHAGLILLPDVLQRVHEQAPLIRTHTSTLSSRQTEMSDQEAEQYDLRVGWLRDLPPHWHSTMLLKEELVVIGSKSNAALKEQLELDDFLRLRHIGLASSRPQFQNLIDQTLAKMNLRRNLVSTISQFTMVPFIVARSNLVAMFPRRLASAYLSLVDIKISSPPFPFEQFSVSMAWHERVHHDPGHKWLRALIVACAKALAGHSPLG